MKKWINKGNIQGYPALTEEEGRKALSFCIEGTLENTDCFKNSFPYAASTGNIYPVVANTGWTTGFYTGQVWLSCENAETEEERDRLLGFGLGQVESFYERIKSKTDVDHHDMGFLYSPSCVAAYKLTGSERAKEAAILAADQLITRFQPVGEFIQAWGEMGAGDNYRFIIDCLLNLPLLYWASAETGDGRYSEIADKHIHTAMRYVIREDFSTWHTVFMDPLTGAFDHGATCQGYKDGSAWARGQAWGIYGTALAYSRTGSESYYDGFRRVTDYFLEHLPDDLCPFWDLTFGNGDEKEEPRDSSSAAIAACGMLHMAGYLREKGLNDQKGQTGEGESLSGNEAAYYEDIAKKMLKTLTDDYLVKTHRPGGGLLLHGTYSKKSPYNTCTPEGVDECVIWGDYFYMEALQRLIHPDWRSYWQTER
ncbi:MAG: glycoside hydrolase family 88 protein [Lachnospiraceae bacterium]|nr:glycoside hydrolase family 88 protein [Lachnospiraceae bacterium]